MRRDSAQITRDGAQILVRCRIAGDERRAHEHVGIPREQMLKILQDHTVVRAQMHLVQHGI